LYAGALTRELRALDPTISISGLAGPQFAAAGGTLVDDYRDIAVTGLTEAIAKLPRSFAARRRLVSAAQKERPDALVLVDFPDFNFRLAPRIKRLGVPVIYYISPQIWAWRAGPRRPALRRRADTEAGRARDRRRRYGHGARVGGRRLDGLRNGDRSNRAARHADGHRLSDVAAVVSSAAASRDDRDDWHGESDRGRTDCARAGSGRVHAGSRGARGGVDADRSRASRAHSHRPGQRAGAARRPRCEQTRCSGHTA